MIEHDNDAADSGLITSSPASWLHTVSGDDPYLVVDIFATITNLPRFNNDGATCNGVAMTALGEERVGTTGAGWIFTYGIIPADGVNTIEWSWHDSGGASGTAAWGASTSYLGVHQNEPTEAFTSGDSITSDPISLTVTPVADDAWVHAAVFCNDATITAGQTARNALASAGAATEDTGPISPAAAKAMTYSGFSGTSWAATGFALRPAPEEAISRGLIQMLDFIVDPTVDAILTDDGIHGQTPPGDPGWEDEDGVVNPRHPTRKVRRKGSAMRPKRGSLKVLPTAVDDSLTANVGDKSYLVDVLANDTYVGTPRIVIIDMPTNGRARVVGRGSASRIRYTPPARGDATTDHVTYQVRATGNARSSGNVGSSDVAVLQVTVQAGIAEYPAVFHAQIVSAGPEGDGTNYIQVTWIGAGLPTTGVFFTANGEGSGSGDPNYTDVYVEDAGSIVGLLADMLIAITITGARPTPPGYDGSVVVE